MREFKRNFQAPKKEKKIDKKIEELMIVTRWTSPWEHFHRLVSDQRLPSN